MASLWTTLPASGGGDCAATSYGVAWRDIAGWRRDDRGAGEASMAVGNRGEAAAQQA
jgi:hypothetical protein